MVKKKKKQRFNKIKSIWSRDSIRYFDGSSVELLAQSEFSEDRRKTSHGICLSNLTEPTKPVVYTDRSGVAGRYPPTNYSFLFILFTRMRADALSALVYTQTRSRRREKEGGREGEREGEREREKERERERERDRAVQP